MKDNFQGTYFSAHLLRFWKFIRKITRIALELIFFVSQKFVTYKILNTLKLFSFTIDSSVLLNEGFRFSFLSCSLFVLLIVNLAGISSPIYFTSFEYFLSPINFTLYMSTMLVKKVCQFGHKLGDMTNSDWIIFD